MLSPELTRLHADLSDALKGVPGARQLVCFGSNRIDEPDAFSDLDLQLLVDDCPAALPALLSVVGEVIAPQIEWTFSDDPNHYWLMAIPDAARPWLKVDVGLDPYNAGKPADLGWRGVAEWTQDAPSQPKPVTSSPDWPRPPLGTIANYVTWHLIDLGQMAKYHHRHQPLNLLHQVAHLEQAVVTVVAHQQGMGGDPSALPFDVDITSPTIRTLDQSGFMGLGNLNVPLVDHIHRLATTLSTLSGADARTMTAFEQIIAGSMAVLRGTSQ